LHNRNIGPDEAQLDRDRCGASGKQTVIVLRNAGHGYLMLFGGDTIAQPQRCRRALGVEPA
jgi:hypothetical protein